MLLRGVDGRSLLLYKVYIKWLTFLGADIHISSNILFDSLFSKKCLGAGSYVDGGVDMIAASDI